MPNPDQDAPETQDLFDDFQKSLLVRLHQLQNGIESRYRSGAVDNDYDSALKEDNVNGAFALDEIDTLRFSGTGDLYDTDIEGIDAAIAKHILIRSPTSRSNQQLRPHPEACVTRVSPKACPESVQTATNGDVAADCIDAPNGEFSSEALNSSSSQGFKSGQGRMSRRASIQTSSGSSSRGGRRTTTEVLQEFKALTSSRCSLEDALSIKIVSKMGSTDGLEPSGMDSITSDKALGAVEDSTRRSVSEPRIRQTNRNGSMASMNSEAAFDSPAGTSSEDPADKYVRRRTQRFSGTLPQNVIRQGRGTVADELHALLDVPDSSHKAACYNSASQLINSLSVIVPLCQSADIFYGIGAGIVETSFEAFFLMEMCLRFYVLPDRRQYLYSVHNWVDFASVLPLVPRIAFGFKLDRNDEQHILGLGSVDLMLTVVPMVRIFRLVRRFEKFLLLKHAFIDAAQALPVLMYTLATIALIFGCLIYLCEPRDNIETLSDALWLTLVTMSTVGYGDTTPQSTPGHLVVGVLIICSALYMAMPLGIIGSAFNNVWTNRDCILLVNRARDQLNKRGYAATDIPTLFKLFSSDPEEGELTRNDFVQMIEGMNINIPTERCILLFEAFDTDGGGTIDAMEFIRQVFPKAYHVLYGDSLEDGNEAEEEEEEEEEGGDDAGRRNSSWGEAGTSSMTCNE